MPIFKLKGNPDPRAKLDGNAILLSSHPETPIKPHMVVDERILHLSGTRNCHLIKVELQKPDKAVKDENRYLYFVNTHLHDLMHDDYLRLT